MKTIGIIGGITWLSSIDYYRLLNQMVSEKTGGADTAKIILYSFNFGETKTLTAADAAKYMKIINHYDLGNKFISLQL